MSQSYNVLTLEIIKYSYTFLKGDGKMKKSILILSCIMAAALMFTSCDSTEAEQTAAQQAAMANVMGADGVKRPEWVLAGKEDSTGIYAVGSGKMSNTTNSLKLAEINGRAALTRTVAAATQSVLRTYTQDTGNSKDVLTYLEEATQVKAANVLKGSKRKDMWTAQDGTVFVLMYVPYEAVLPTLTEPIQEAAKNLDNFKQDAKTVLTEAKALAAFEKYFDNN